MSEFPEPSPAYYVMETHRLDGGGTATIFASGPFDDPDRAKWAREQLHTAEPARNLHCAECSPVGRDAP